MASKSRIASASVPETPVPDHILVKAAQLLHAEHGVLRKASVVGAEVHGLNARGQLVVTDRQTVLAHIDRLGGYDPVEAADAGRGEDDDQAGDE